MQPSNYPGKEEKIKEMFYKGNLLMLGLNSRIKSHIKTRNDLIRSSSTITEIKEINNDPTLRKRIPFKQDQSNRN